MLLLSLFSWGRVQSLHKNLSLLFSLVFPTHVVIKEKWDFKISHFVGRWWITDDPVCWVLFNWIIIPLISITSNKTEYAYTWNGTNLKGLCFEKITGDQGFRIINCCSRTSGISSLVIHRSTYVTIHARSVRPWRAEFTLGHSVDEMKNLKKWSIWPSSFLILRKLEFKVGSLKGTTQGVLVVCKFFISQYA